MRNTELTEQNGTAPPRPLSIDQQSQLLTFVEHVNTQQLDWQSVREKLRQLQSAIPCVVLDIVAETENIGGTVTYCLLVTHGSSVYSISCAAQNALPWQLRGATNAEANDLLTVNGHKVTVEDAVHLLDFIWEKEDIATRIIDTALLANEIAHAPIELNDDEFAQVLPQFYSERRLQTPEAKQEWLDSRGLTEARLRSLLQEVILRRRAEQALVEAQFQVEWRDRAHDYTGVRVMQAVIPADCVSEAERLTKAHAQERNISSIVNELARGISYRYPFRIEFAELIRYEVGTDADKVIGQPVGNVVLARMATEEVRLIEIVAIESELSDATLRRRIMRKLMDQWYRDKRSRARIEWHWGRSA